mgnify:CR=1 FL=1
MKVQKWLQVQAGSVKALTRGAVGLGVLGTLLMIGQAWLVATVLAALITGQSELAAVMPQLWLLLGLFVARAGVTWASEQVALRAARRVKTDMRQRLFAHLQALGPVHGGAAGSGELATTLMDGVEALEAFFARYLPQLSLMTVIPLAILTVVLPFDWISALIFSITAPLIPIFMILIGKGTEKANRKQWRILARMSNQFLDMIQGLTTLKVLNASRREAANVASSAEAYRRATMAVLRTAFLSSLVLEFFATVSIAMVAVLIGFRLYNGQLEFQHGLFILLLAPEFYQPLRTMGTLYHARLDAVAAGERMQAILAMAPMPRPAAPQALANPAALDIRLANVTYAYSADNEPALTDVSLVIAPRETVALVGPSGGGKTTVMRLLLGFIQPQSGMIRVNDQDLTQLDLEAWRRQLAWVPQAPRIFQGSIADNIRLGDPNASLEAVRQAAARAQADEFIERLPQHYDTRVGEGGQGLSGGQRQRLALARAFLRDAPLVLLDEATASLDPHNEARVQAGIERLAEGRSLLVIAHRLNTVRRADRIYVLSGGQVVEQGRHDVLVAQGGKYTEMTRVYQGEAA